MVDRLRDSYDVVVIGGGAAGLSGALTLSRALRRVVVLDSGRPRNAPAAGVHGLLGREGTEPAELLARGRAEVRRYGGEVVPGEVETVRRDENGQGAATSFVVRLTDGSQTRARRLLVATGLADELPDIPGLSQRWGRDVLHCPYCHGWEARHRTIGVLATGPMSVHQALLLRQWSEHVRFFSRGRPVTNEQAEQLAARGIATIDGEVVALQIVDDTLLGVRLGDGSVVELDFVAVSPRMVARAGFLTELGLHPVPRPMGESLAADATGRTDVPGVWVAGNVSDPMAQVGMAAAAGSAAAAQLNADLVTEETERAVRTLRVIRSSASAAQR
ncbi:thioredoxin reductase [Saccharomonospora amisosensis]|uniref:Thioredoxin reductase n=1 Tax=Saccharomonospora amisosensis TaxID=1128677 RepID=A0A7X5URM7_9PSEU|nr:NAD(P)/FAD-dependent oxidoreductase [Saccharomonospora amisosensis]NIJ12951.1 thioredoxin reductase [Saccharomonospora amisosensis]